MAEKAKSEEQAKKPAPVDRVIAALEDKKKRLQHKLEKRIPNFSKQTREGSEKVTQQQIESIDEQIKKLKAKR